MPIAPVQSATQVQVDASSSNAPSITINGTVAGNCLVAYASIFDNNTTWTLTSVTDGGNTWIVRAAKSQINATQTRAVVAVAVNITGGARTIAFNLSGTSGAGQRYYTLGCLEWPPLSSEDAFDVNENVDITTNDVTAGPITTTDAADLIVGCTAPGSLDATMNYASPTSWTNSYRENNANAKAAYDAGYWLPGGIQTNYTAQWAHDNTAGNQGGAVIVALKPAVFSLLTDFNVRTEPALPTIAAAGDKVVDPVFGTTILRVSDAGDGASVLALYPSYPSINCNNTRVIGNLGSTMKAWNLNAANFTVSAGPTVTNWTGNERYYSHWSGTDPDVVYVTNGSIAAKIFKFNLATNTATLVRDFTADLPANYKLSQMQHDLADNIFCASVMNASFVGTGYIVWKRDTDDILLLDTGVASFNECYVDKTGEYFYYQVGCVNTVYSLTPPTLLATTGATGPPVDSTDFCHNGPGVGTVFTNAGNGRGMSYRSLAGINTVTILMQDYMTTATQGFHQSFNTTDESYGLLSRYHLSGGSVTAAFDNEILLVRTTGNAVKRVCHHRCIYPANYPRASISPDGKFIAFTSNWGGASGHNRNDLYLVEVPVDDPPTRCGSLLGGQGNRLVIS